MSPVRIGLPRGRAPLAPCIRHTRHPVTAGALHRFAVLLALAVHLGASWALCMGFASAFIAAPPPGRHVADNGLPARVDGHIAPQRRRALLAELGVDRSPAGCRRARAPAGRRTPRATAPPSASTAASTPPPPPRSPACAGHSSKHMTMSEPSSRWISMLLSGQRSMCREPSTWLWKVTPASVSFRKPDEAHHLEPAAVGQDRPLTSS